MMKNLLTTTLILTLFVQTSWAQQSCPLTNSKLTDLRAAASKLAKTITLSAECKAYQDTVNQTNSELKGLAEEIAKSDEGGEISDKESTAIEAVSKLDTITNLFKDKKCGEQLSGFLGYTEAFIDVATGMSPFLALYGGPAAMPWVLGTALGGAAVKTFISFFKNKSIDMRNPDQSDMFIKNSCSFYNLDMIKTSIDDLQLNQSTKLENELAKAREKLNIHLTRALKEPGSNNIDRLNIAEKDEEKIKYLQEHFKADPFEACIYISAYASFQDGPGNNNLVSRVWLNYEETINKTPFRLELEKRYFIDDLNHSAATVREDKCKEVGSRWLNKMESLSQKGIALLRKKVSEEPEVAGYEVWKNEKKKLEETIKVLEAKIKFFQEMTSQGFNIEYSEIIRSHEMVQDSIFESYKYLVVLRTKGLAEAWLKVKQEDSHKEYKTFLSMKKDTEKRIRNIEQTVGISPLTNEAVADFADEYFEKNGKEHPEVHNNVLVDVCNQLRQTWSSWYNGLIHAKAGKDYCVTFDKVINKLEYPHVQKLCFGTSSKIGYRHSSLKNQVRDFNSLRPLADEVIAKMHELSCQKKGEFSQEILKLPLE
ncbi:MAG: hypothetical protein ACLGHN_10545 [Bacteriovoracia bacterium]